MPTFTPLRVRSHGTLLAGTASPEQLVDRALELGCDALALTDRDNLYLVVRFLQHAAKVGLRALPGAELTHGRTAALLLPVDRRGWAHLCALLTARRLDADFDLVRALGERHAGLHVIVESPALAAALVAAGVPPALPAAAERARALQHRGGLWLGVRGLPRERAGLRERLAAAWRLGVPAVATGDVMLREGGEHEAHRVAVTAAAGELLERMPPGSFCSPEAWLASPAEWERRVRSVCAGGGCADAADALLENNAALVERCRCEISMGVPILPSAPLPDGVTEDGALRAAALAGVARRYPAPAARRAALLQMETELALISRLGFTGYFLLVANIVAFAQSRGIPSVGRGSGASSIVSYLLGVTNVDPLRYGLCFERFLHPQRRDCPDLDVDLCWRRRDEVIAHVYDAYGHDRVAMISTHATLGPRSAFREAAKALGVPLPRVNALARRIPRGELPDPSALEKTLHAGRAEDFREPRVGEALRLAATLAGAPRHLGIHCGGLVIADRELTHYLPLERAAKGVVVSQFEMRAVEAIGLVKMDLLGNRAITTIGECITLAQRAVAEGVPGAVPPPDPDTIAEDDAPTARTVATGDTLHCFQLESPAMRHLLRMLRARTLDDTVAAVALVRPGPAESGMKEAFCRRARGLEPVAYPHERLRATLAETHGVMLYEEDVMRVAAALCGLPLAEGETLRRAIAGARDDEEFRFLERGFLSQAVRTGVDEASARAVWRDLTRFAGYAFCKAHAAGYGKLGWQAAWFKTHFPAAWGAGVLNHHAGMYPAWVHVEDLRRHGVTFAAPCAQASGWDSTLEPGSPAGTGGIVRVGLHRVTGLSHATGERLLAARAARPFASFADFTDRVRPTPPELEALVLAGACDFTHRARAALLLEARIGSALAARAGTARAAARRGARRGARTRRACAHVEGGSAARGRGGRATSGRRALPELAEFALAPACAASSRRPGLWFSAHPPRRFAPERVRRGCVSAASLEQHVGRRVSIVGIPCASRRARVEDRRPRAVHHARRRIGTSPSACCSRATTRCGARPCAPRSCAPRAAWTTRSARSRWWSSARGALAAKRATRVRRAATATTP
ncbi:MAG: DNA polymerase III subunit alpha [Candidatus Eisenbacteria bacterium]